MGFSTEEQKIINEFIGNNAALLGAGNYNAVLLKLEDVLKEAGFFDWQHNPDGKAYALRQAVAKGIVDTVGLKKYLEGISVLRWGTFPSGRDYKKVVLNNLRAEGPQYSMLNRPKIDILEIGPEFKGFSKNYAPCCEMEITHLVVNSANFKLWSELNGGVYLDGLNYVKAEDLTIGPECTIAVLDGQFPGIMKPCRGVYIKNKAQLLGPRCFADAPEMDLLELPGTIRLQAKDSWSEIKRVNLIKFNGPIGDWIQFFEEDFKQYDGEKYKAVKGMTLDSVKQKELDVVTTNGILTYQVEGWPFSHNSIDKVPIRKA